MLTCSAAGLRFAVLLERGAVEAAIRQRLRENEYSTTRSRQHCCTVEKRIAFCWKRANQRASC
jgi:hypothetical protein